MPHSAIAKLNLSAITATIEQLRQLCQANVQSGWRCCDEDLPIEIATQAQNWHQWKLATLNAKSHIAWSRGQQVLWLGQRFTVPLSLNQFPLIGMVFRLGLTWWAESSEIFVNGQFVQAGDLFDHSTRILLSSAVESGDTFDVALRLVSPGHDDGALVRSHCLYESSHGIDPGFVADELAILLKRIETFAPEQIADLRNLVKSLDWSVVADAGKFINSLTQLRQQLLNFNVQTSTISLLGHAHLDLAWLWPVSETWDAAQRTFSSVLNLQQDYPHLTFCHSTPALYHWVEQHRPDLFQGIQHQIKTGNWEFIGGLWVEPEFNTVSGESIVRQVIYGQQYFLEKFGKISPIAWLPDSFGFSWQLPQILKQGQIEYFVTQKLRWNDTTEFPYDLFWWRSPDGTQILSLMSSPIGEAIDPVKMGDYAVNWEAKTELKNALWLFGVGDRGGGPTRDMLEVAERWKSSPFLPKLAFTTAQAYLQDISQNESKLPVWNDELYLEFHRGCYTTHADQKWLNRKCEGLLYQAELYASLATIMTGKIYPKHELKTAWKKVLFNQFHDILPGSAIPQVYVDAKVDWDEAEQISKEILEESLSAIASQIRLPQPPSPEAKPIVVFNSLNWARSQVITVSLPSSKTPWQVYNSEGKKLASQQLNQDTLTFLVQDIPAVGYRLFWLSPATAEQQVNSALLQPQEFILENDALKVIVNPETGEISNIFYKINRREILNNSGNQLQAFQDSGQYWDAWNIDPNYAQHPLPQTQLKSIEWVTFGEIQKCLRVVRNLGQSEFIQDYILEANSSLLKISTSVVNWQEKHVLVKAAFPLNLEANYATYEIPCGAIQRTTKPQTPAEKAKWEVPALNWADLTDKTANYGVSLLNDCKYGYDAQPSELRLTLLRSSSWPDPDADQGYHQFTYAIYPHQGSWEEAATVRQGYELNLPLEVWQLANYCSNSGTLPTRGQFLDLQADNLILMAFKQSEANSDQWVLRCYECCGKEAQIVLKSDLDLQLIQAVDLLEQSTEQSTQIEPWKISSWIVQSGEVAD